MGLPKNTIEVIKASVMKVKYKCKYCGALYLKKDKVPMCCQRAFDSKGNTALELLEVTNE